LTLSAGFGTLPFYLLGTGGRALLFKLFFGCVLSKLVIFILFDIDGTLLYSDKLDSRCFANSYEAIFGQPFPTIDWTKFAEVTDHVIFRTAFHDHFGRFPTELERLTFEEHYLDALRNARSANPAQFCEIPGAARLWHHLEADERYLPGIATGGWQRPAAIKLAHVGIPPTQPFAGYANDKFSRVDILNEAINKARAAHAIDRIIYVGDASWDVTTTKKMNLPLIGIRRAGDHHSLHDLGAERVITDYSDPQSFFDHLHAALG
jgi:phosphoglycolate phosphatase-like HAD superfamily hydrolase